MISIEILSERERQVSDLVMQGLLNKQIALLLGISERTVEFHLNNIYTKLQIGSRVELAIHLLKSTGDADNAKPVESTVDNKESDTHNDSQPNAKARWRKALKHTLSLIKKETVTTMKIFSEDFNNYFRTRPLFTGSMLILITGFAAHFIVSDYGLYFPISYVLLGLLLAIGSLHFGLSWRKIRDGKYHLKSWIAIAFILSPLIVIAVDTILLHTVARSAGEVMMNLPGISNRAAWFPSADGMSRLSTERSTTDHEIWLFGSLLYILLLTAAGNIAGKWFKADNPISA